MSYSAVCSTGNLKYPPCFCRTFCCAFLRLRLVSRGFSILCDGAVMDGNWNWLTPHLFSHHCTHFPPAQWNPAVSSILLRPTLRGRVCLHAVMFFLILSLFLVFLLRICLLLYLLLYLLSLFLACDFYWYSKLSCGGPDFLAGWNGWNGWLELPSGSLAASSTEVLATQDKICAAKIQSAPFCSILFYSLLHVACLLIVPICSILICSGHGSGLVRRLDSLFFLWLTCI